MNTNEIIEAHEATLTAAYEGADVTVIVDVENPIEEEDGDGSMTVSVSWEEGSLSDAEAEATSEAMVDPAGYELRDSGPMGPHTQGFGPVMVGTYARYELAQ